MSNTTNGWGELKCYTTKLARGSVGGGGVLTQTHYQSHLWPHVDVEHLFDHDEEELLSGEARALALPMETNNHHLPTLAQSQLHVA